MLLMVPKYGQSLQLELVCRKNEVWITWLVQWTEILFVAEPLCSYLLEVWKINTKEGWGQWTRAQAPGPGLIINKMSWTSSLGVLGVWGRLGNTRQPWPGFLRSISLLEWISIVNIIMIWKRKSIGLFVKQTTNTADVVNNRTRKLYRS